MLNQSEFIQLDKKTHLPDWYRSDVNGLDSLDGISNRLIGNEIARTDSQIVMIQLGYFTEPLVFLPWNSV